MHMQDVGIVVPVAVGESLVVQRAGLGQRPAPSRAREIRVNAEVGLAELAAEIPCSVRSLRCWESGKVRPSRRLVARWAALLHAVATATDQA